MFLSQKCLMFGVVLLLIFIIFFIIPLFSKFNVFMASKFHISCVHLRNLPIINMFIPFAIILCGIINI
ncbi:073R [Invertebrate iridescent virus Kaz2018]|nr:073R [Invertebrate iridescent virus Kaz2018]